MTGCVSQCVSGEVVVILSMAKGMWGWAPERWRAVTWARRLCCCNVAPLGYGPRASADDARGSIASVLDAFQAG